MMGNGHDEDADHSTNQDSLCSCQHGHSLYLLQLASCQNRREVLRNGAMHTDGRGLAVERNGWIRGHQHTAPEFPRTASQYSTDSLAYDSETLKRRATWTQGRTPNMRRAPLRPLG